MSRRGVLSSRRSGTCQTLVLHTTRRKTLRGLLARCDCCLSTYVLVDKQNRNVFPLACEAVKRRLDSAVFRLCIHDQEVLLRVRGLRHVLQSVNGLAFLQHAHSAGRLTPTPASSMPVTVSCRALALGTLHECSAAHLIANDGEELPVFVLRGRGCHGVFACCAAAVRLELGGAAQ